MPSWDELFKEKKTLLVYFISVFLLIVIALAIFRIFVRRDYQRKGQLTLVSGFLELLIWGLYMSFPYIYNPAEWVYFWSRNVPVSAPVRVAGLICIAVGLALAFGTMIWFGLRRALGLQVDELNQRGPYRLTRNPQLVGGSLLVIGTVVLWPSWYALGWAALYGVVGHLMVVTEEEHLREVYGEEYERYCEQVPRYLGLWQRS
jgi:protein-S-isoprenylcysteine O-methyltransferase Ste14